MFSHGFWKDHPTARRIRGQGHRDALLLVIKLGRLSSGRLPGVPNTKSLISPFVFCPLEAGHRVQRTLQERGAHLCLPEGG